MKLRKTLIAITASIPLLFIAACSSPLIYSSVWQSKPVTVDGKAKEWKIPLDYFDDKTKLNFTVTNDKNNLYVCVRATEDETQKGIIHTGLQIWIDTTGGKKNQVGIQFPIIERSANSLSSSRSQNSDSYEPSSASSGNSDNRVIANSLRKHYQGTEKQIKLSGFTNASNGLSEVPNLYGINACLNWDTNSIMIYEACIPFSTFYKASLSPSDSNKVLGISFVVTVSPRNHGGEGGGGHSHGGGMGGGGMGGGMGGGGMHGGGGQGGGGGSSSPEVLTANIKFRLATMATSK
jgi:hypothetical protein